MTDQPEITTALDTVTARAEAAEAKLAEMREGGDKAVASATEEVAARTCTCPLDEAPALCMQKFALSDCLAAAALQSPPPPRPAGPTREEIAAIILESQPPKGFKHRWPNALAKADAILSLFTGGRG